MALPQKLPLELMQTAWATALNPLIDAPLASSNLLEGVQLVIGANSVNHKLQRKLRGWSIVRINGVSSIYDTQDSNQLPDLTLALNSSAAVTVSILVF